MNIFKLILLLILSFELRGEPEDVQNYRYWKKTIQTRMIDMEKNTMPQQAIHLVKLIERYKEKSEQNMLHVDEKRNMLFAYNFLRELLHVDEANSLDEIDELWLGHIKETVEEILLLEKTYLPTHAMQSLVNQARKVARYEDDVIALSSKDEFGGSSHKIGNKYFIEVCQTPDLDKRLFVVYHELAHLMHNDQERNKLVWFDKIEPSVFLNEPSFKTDLEKIHRYKKIGKNVLNNNSVVGRRLKEALQNKTTLWIKPKDAAVRTKWMYFRGKEQRADLFAMKTLLEQGYLSSLLTMIEYWGNPVSPEEYYVVAQFDFDEHPSNVERALYFIGFLADRGFDVNKALVQWEIEGVCVSAEKNKHYNMVNSTGLNTTISLI